MLRVLSLFKRRTRSDIVTTKPFCTVYTTYTRNALLLCLVLALSKQMFGEPIACLADNHASESLLNTHCFVNGTFTKEGTARFHHGYYQWVNTALLLQAIGLNLPHNIWNAFMYRLFKDMSLSERTLNVSHCEYVLRVLGEQQRSFHRRYLVLEASYVVMVLVQLVSLHLLFDRRFLQFDPRLFPLFTTCELGIIGPSGSAAHYSYACWMPLNVLYAKVFWVMLLWFYGLVGVHVARLIRKTVVCRSPGHRCLYEIARHNLREPNASYIEMKLAEWQ